MRIVSFWNISLLLFCLSALGEDKTVKLTGVLVEKGTRKPLSGVNVFVLPAKVKAVTDEKGNFVVEGVPEGEFTWVVNQSGYEKLEKEDSQKSEGPNGARRLLLTKLSYEIYETTVYGKEEKRDDKEKSLKPSEFLKMPGSNGDPVKAVQNLPGVARPSGFTSQVIIEGAAPQDTVYNIDGHRVPVIFHFGGLTSVIFPEALERVDYKASGYGPEYGRALAGHIGAWTRPGRTDRFHGVAYADVFQAGLLIDTPVGDSGSLMIGGRNSYFGQVLGLVLKGNDDFDLTVAPSYRDLVGVYDLKITDHIRFHMSAMGSIDRLEFLFSTPVSKNASGRGSFTNTTSFYRFIPQLMIKHSDDLSSRFSLSYGRDFIHFDILDSYFDLATYNLGARGEVDYKVLPEWRAQLGFDNNYTYAKYGFRFSGGFGPDGVTSGPTLKFEDTPSFSEVGLYLRNTIEVPRTALTLSPGVRTEYFNVTKEVVPQPRIGAKFKIDEYLSVRAAVGYYAQAPRPQEIDEVVGNSGLKSQRAWHYSLGFEKDFREGRSEGFIVSSDAFYKSLDRLVVDSSKYITRDGQTVAERYNNEGKGKIFGLVNSFKYMQDSFKTSLSYTISRSRRTDNEHGEYAFQYDQTHILTFLASYEFAEGISIGTRVRYVSGNPNTPVIGGVFDSDDDLYRRYIGPYNSDRLDPFFAWDVRIDKKWVFEDWIFSMYLDVQNLTNRQNVESLRYSYDFKKNEKVSFLPLLPTFGLKGEF